MTLTDFLLARIADTEAYACEVAGIHPDGTINFDAHPASHVSNILLDLAQEVLRDCEAKRRIVQACTTELSGRDIQGAMMDGDDGPWLADHILHTLALPYADHPDYRDEWRP